VLTDDARYAALLTRDPRFDGVFFVGVSTTGIYCRPICPARTPGRARCTFYRTPAQAEAAGFRACFRCRPELAPGSSELGSVDAVDALVQAAARKITEGALNEASVDDLAAELGVSARHLRRATEARLGVSPVELAQTRRLALAKQLLQDTALPLTEIAFAAGFGSVRRFNAAFIETMGKAPSLLRRAHVEVAPPAEALELRLDYRPPYAWDELLAFLRARAVPGVERVDRDSYRRNVRLGEHRGAIAVRQASRRDALVLSVAPSLLPALMPLVAHVRRMFDLDARPDVIARVLGADRTLGPLVRARPGLRLPGAIDPFEASVRALLGQQVSVAAATTLAGRFATAFGQTYAGGDGLERVFPTAAEVARLSPEAIAAIGLPGARAAAMHGFARAIVSGALSLGAGELDPFVEQAVALPGIGPWTAHYLAMRALHLPDAFPASDLGIKKALSATPRAAEERAAAWRPFRSYAVMHLWTSLGDTHADDHDEHLVPARTAAPVRARRGADRRVPAGSRAGAARPAGGRARAHDARARARRGAAARVLRR